MKVALLYFTRDNSYQYGNDWITSFHSFKDLDITEYCVNSSSLNTLKKVNDADLIILLYSFDIIYYTSRKEKRAKALNSILKNRKGKLVFFGRNEFHRFPFRRNLITELGIDLMVSQLTTEASNYLYSDLTKTISLPHALNPIRFSPEQPFQKRTIKIGSRSAKYPDFLLDRARNNIIEGVKNIQKKRPSWVLDYETDEERRFSRSDWGKFLNNCQFTISSEAGAAFVEKDDQIVSKLKKIEYKNHVLKKIKSTFGNIASLLPSGLSHIEMKQRYENTISHLPNGHCISSRHFDAMGCGVAQILIEGQYNNILQPNIHYLELKKDWSNIDDIIAKMEDIPSIQKMIKNTYHYVIKNHTHRHRITTLLANI